MRSGDVAAAVSAQCALEDSCLVFWDTTTAQEALEAFESTGRTVGILQARSLPTFLPSHAYSQHSRTTERIVSRERSYCGREVTCHSMAHGDHVTAE